MTRKYTAFTEQFKIQTLALVNKLNTTIAQLARDLCIRHKKTKIPRNNVGFANNILNREFIATAPNSKCASDTTFICKGPCIRVK